MSDNEVQVGEKDATGIAKRKREHMEIARSAASQGARDPGWDDVHLVHAALPDVRIEEVSTETEFLGHKLRAPLILASMTGGHPDAVSINAALGTAAERTGIAVGVGSQRAALSDPSLEHTYRVLREHAPSAVVLANVGICQLVWQGATPPFTPANLQRAVDMVEAQALIVHLNVTEELIQTEGDRATGGFLEAIQETVRKCPVPVIAKETGSGLSKETAQLLAEAGVAALDVGGAGGTSFAQIEAVRAARAGDRRGARLGATFADWGLSTAVSVLETKASGLPVIATGGVRNGLHVAKALALGGSLGAMGRVILEAASQGADVLEEEIELVLEELRVAMVLTSSSSLQELRERTPVLTGHTAEWARARDLPY